MKPFLVTLLLAAVLPLNAQIVTGSMSGSVQDPSGLAVPEASVSVVHVATGRTRETSTDVGGAFAFNGLEAGEYRLVVSKTGFKQLEKSGVVLPAGVRLPLGTLALQVGQLAETVTVAAAGGDIVQTESSERADIITSDQVENLQVLGRNAPSLVQLLPGVVMNNDPDALDRNTTFSALGGRHTTNALNVDGIPSTDVSNGFDLKLGVSMDAVAEVRILVSNYQAEHGRVSGANIQLVTKSGTRQFHGMGSYFKRHEQFNANNFFNNRLSVAKPRYRYNTWSYNVGGPVFIPGKFNRNREKLFFFWSQEFWPRRESAFRSITVPTAAERAGDFSQSLDQSGKLTIVQDPFNAKTPFPGNRVPAGRLDPSGVALLKLFPQPNLFDRNISAGAYNYVFNSELEAPKRTTTLKVDHNFDSNNMLFGSLTLYHETSKGYIGVPGWQNTWDQHYRVFDARNKGLSTRYTRIVSPTVSNEFQFAWFDNPETITSPPDALTRNQRDAVGFTAGQLYPKNNALNMLPAALFGGVPNAASIVMNGRFPVNDPYHLFSWSDKLTLVRGRHTLKAGLNVERFWRSIGVNSTQYGSFNFQRNAANPLDSGYAYSNAALGTFRTYTESSAVPYYRARGGRIEWFAQDSWRVTPKLALEYGVRLYWLTPTYDRDGNIAGFVPGRFDPARQAKLIAPGFDERGRRAGIHPVTGAAYPVEMIGAIAPGSGDPVNGMLTPKDAPGYPRALYNNRGWHYGPRIGFAYDPFGKGKTSLRGGFGMFYNAPSVSTWNSFTNQAPIVFNPMVYNGTLSGLSSSMGVIFPGAVRSMDPVGKIPTVMNYSFSFQQNIGFRTVLDASYVGALGRHLLWLRNLNAIPFGTDFKPESRDATNNAVLPAAFLYPTVGYTDILAVEPAGTSNYHSLQVTVNRRFARGFQFGASWTWSKALNYNDSDTTEVSALVPVRIWNYGLSNMDRTHSLKVNWLYTLPNARWRNPISKTVLNGWQASGIATFQSGAPLPVNYTLITGIDISGSPTDSARIVVTGNPVLPKTERTFYRNFRTEVFQLPAVGTIGNAPRTVIRGPGINNWDLSLFKNFPVTESTRFQFRCELYNAFNHTQFSALDNTARFERTGEQVSGSFGQFTAARKPRQMQLALRFYF